MACVSGLQFVFFLSEDGTAYCFGQNSLGQLGLGHKDTIHVPCMVPNLPKIQFISCGYYHTVCVDEEGGMWTFGQNSYGQLGTGNIRDSLHPQKIENIPFVTSVSCGGYHTLFITNENDLWSIGHNSCGQLFLGNYSNKDQPTKTNYSNVVRISTGDNVSFLQNDSGIYGCGRNEYGQLGLGHTKSPQVIPQLIENQPSNIIQFCTGYNHSLFLDIEGNVFSVGNNDYGKLGRSTPKMDLLPVKNIPPIQLVSCVGHSSYLLDFNGKVWSFGGNAYGQLGLGDTRSTRDIPTEISSVNYIHQISSGSCGDHLLLKDAKDNIYFVGHGLSTEIIKTSAAHRPVKIDSCYSSVWGVTKRNRFELKSRAKSARK